MRDSPLFLDTFFVLRNAFPLQCRPDHIIVRSSGQGSHSLESIIRMDGAVEINYMHITSNACKLQMLAIVWKIISGLTLLSSNCLEFQLILYTIILEDKYSTCAVPRFQS